MPRAGMAGVGRPVGTGPTTRIPSSCSENSATTAVARATVMSGPGNRGTSRCRVNSNTTIAVARMTVGQCNWSSRLRNDAIWRDEFVPVDLDAGDLPQLAGDHDDGHTGHVADQDGFGQQIGQEAEPGQSPQQAEPADQQGQRGGQPGVPDRIACRDRHQHHRGHQRGRRLRPDRQLPGRPEQGVGSKRCHDGPQPDHRRQACHLGVGHHLRDQVGGDGETGQDVATQPAAPVVPELAEAGKHSGRPAPTDACHLRNPVTLDTCL